MAVSVMLLWKCENPIDDDAGLIFARQSKQKERASLVCREIIALCRPSSILTILQGIYSISIGLKSSPCKEHCDRLVQLPSDASGIQ